MTTINAQTIINAVMQAHACAPEEGSDLISFAISAKGVQKVKNCKANLLRFAELVRKNARAFVGGIARTIKPRAAVIWPAQAVRLVYELLQDEQYQDAAALAEEQCGAVFYEFFNNVEKISEAKMIFAPQSVAGLGDEFASGRRENGRYCVFHIPSGLTISGHQRTRKAAEEIATKTWSEASEEQRAHVPTHTRSRSQEAARAQWIAEHGLTSEATETRIAAHEIETGEATAEPEIVETVSLGDRFEAELAKRKAAREALVAQDVAQVVAQAVAAAAISEAMQAAPIGSVAGQKNLCHRAGRIASLKMMNNEIRKIDASEAWHDSNIDDAIDLDALQDSISRCLVNLQRAHEVETCQAGDNEANAPSMGSASTAPAWQPVPQYMPPVPSSTDFGQSKPPAFRGNDLPECGDDAPTPPAMESQPVADTQAAKTVDIHALAQIAKNRSGNQIDIKPLQKMRLICATRDGWYSATKNGMAMLVESGYYSDKGGWADKAAETVQDAPVVAAPIAAPVAQRYTFKPGVQDQKIVSKSGKWMAATRMTSDGLFELGFKIVSGCSWSTTYPTASDRMKALQSMARAADAPTDTPPTGGLPCPIKTPVAHALAVALLPILALTPTPSNQDNPDSLASNPPEKTEGREGSPVQISTPKPVETFKQAGPVRVDLASMIAKGVAPEALIGLGVYCKGDMANPSGSGAITGFSHSDFYGLVVDVTLESGKVWRAVRTGEFLTGWFSLDAKMHGAPYLAQLAATVALLKASASAAKEQAGNARAKALIDLAEQYPQLKRAETSYAGGKLAAANMRILLKTAFKGVKFSVTSDHNSVRVNWEDGPTDDQVNEVVGRFDIGASDAHSDYFYTVSTAFSDLFGGVQYLHTRRHESDALVQQAIDELYQNRDEKPTVQDYRKCSGVFNWDGQNYENRRMRELMNSTPAFSATKSHAKS